VEVPSRLPKANGFYRLRNGFYRMRYSRMYL